MTTRIIKLILFSTVVCSLIILAPWVVTFNGPLSSDPNDWAFFGSYVGGTLSPVIAVMALLGLFYTIYQQQKQIVHLTNNSIKEDLFRIIEKTEKDFESALGRYPIHIAQNGATNKYTGKDAVFNLTFLDYDKVLVNEEDINLLSKEAGDIPKNHPSILCFEMFGEAAGHLNQLKMYVNKYDELSGSNIETKYFKRKYKVPYKRFLERNILLEEW